MRLALGLLLCLLPGLAGAQGLRSAFGPGDLSRFHLEDGQPIPCESCHEAGRFVKEARCLTCHEAIAELRARSTGFHASVPQDGCAGCHLEHRGRSAQLVQLDPDAFDHDRTGFRLQGGHAEVSCSSCHDDGWLGAGRACSACHDSPHGDSLKQPQRFEGCDDCHEVRGFEGAELDFDHGQARFPLEGAHTEVACHRCHEGGRFAPIDHAACTDCHDSPHRAQVGTCTDCHEPGAWEPRRVPHARLGFRLEGLHRGVACRSCHAGDAFARVEHGACADCHDDPHGGAFAPRSCAACHDLQAPAFSPVGFDHQLAWPLEGAHGDVACAGCHGEEGSRTWTGLEHERCAACHDDVHGARFEPDDCAPCHGSSAWAPVQGFGVEEHARTGYELAGLHAEVECGSCHGEAVAPGPEHGSCRSCHDDPHRDLDAGGCGDCHAVDRRWKAVQFEHDPGFGLSGGHAERGCRSCHDVRRFSDVDAACRSCHGEDAPRRHFPQGCDRCHGVDSWPEVTLDAAAHSSIGFPLRGAHLRLSCESCHGEQLGTRCIDCHGPDDPHRNMLGDDCRACHRESTWLRSTFRHSQVGFPLRSEHAFAECADCHAAGFVGTPRACDACHVARSFP